MQFSFEKPRRTTMYHHTPAEQLGITEDTRVWVAVPETNCHKFHVGEELRLFEDNGTGEPYFRSVEREFQQWFVPLSDLSFEALTPADFGWSVGDFGEDSEGTLVQLVSSTKPEFLQFKDGLIVDRFRTELDVRKLKRFPKLPKVFQIKVTWREHAELRQHECIEYVQGAWIAGNVFHEFSPGSAGSVDRTYYLCFDGTAWHWNDVPGEDEGSVTITLEQFTQWLEHRHRIVTLDKQAPVRPVAPEPVPEYNTPAQARGISVGTTVWFTGARHHWLQYGDELVLSMDDGTRFPFFTCTNRGPADFEHCAYLSDVSLINPNKDETTPLQQAGLEVGSVCILKEDYENDMGELVLRKHSTVAVVHDDGSKRPTCRVLQPAHGLFGVSFVFPYVHLLQDTGLKHDVAPV